MHCPNVFFVGIQLYSNKDHNDYNANELIENNLNLNYSFDNQKRDIGIYTFFKKC